MQHPADRARGHIIAMGGGGFAMEPGNPLLDDFVLGLAARHPAQVCFVPTASGDSPLYLLMAYRAFSGRCVLTDLTLADGPVPRRPPRTADIADFVAGQDVIMVGGGNTANLLALWRLHGIDRALHAAWMNGAVLAGVSAGMLCWFAGGVTDSFGGFEPLRDGLGWLPGYACPHYDGEAARRPVLHDLVAVDGVPAVAADDGVALHFIGTELVEAVSSRPGTRAWRVEPAGGAVVETPLPVRVLGGPND